MNTVINTTEVQAIIASFAKANKIGKAKIEALLSDAFSHIPQRKESTGKPVSEESIAIRAALKKLPKGKTFIVADIAKKLNVHPAMVNNNINFLVKTESLFSVSGKQKIDGKRGKPATVWQVM